MGGDSTATQVLCQAQAGNEVPGPVNTTRTVAPGANFSQIEERGATHTGCLLATTDEEMREIGPGPEGCGENRAILRCRPRLWTRHSLPTPPRLAQFLFATPPAIVVLTCFRICNLSLFKASHCRCPTSPVRRDGWRHGRPQKPVPPTGKPRKSCQPLRTPPSTFKPHPTHSFQSK